MSKLKLGLFISKRDSNPRRSMIVSVKIGSYFALFIARCQLDDTMYNGHVV